MTGYQYNQTFVQMAQSDKTMIRISVIITVEFQMRCLMFRGKKLFVSCYGQGNHLLLGDNLLFVYFSQNQMRNLDRMHKSQFLFVDLDGLGILDFSVFCAALLSHLFHVVPLMPSWNNRPLSFVHLTLPQPFLIVSVLIVLNLSQFSSCHFSYVICSLLFRPFFCFGHKWSFIAFYFLYLGPFKKKICNQVHLSNHSFALFLICQ